MANCGLKEEDFYRLYHPQHGGALFYKSTFDRQYGHGNLFYKSGFSRQHGHGIGGIFGAIGRRLLPFLKNIVWPSAKKAISRVAVDVLENNRDWKESVKEQGLEALKGIGANIMNQSGTGIRRRRRVSNNSIRIKPKRRRTRKKSKVRKSVKNKKSKKKRKPKQKRKTVKRLKRKPKFINIFDQE